MKKSIRLFALVCLVFFGGMAQAHAYWIWSPDLGKWINPKKSAKDTPEEQYAWAIEFYNKSEWDRAIEEFEKLPAAFPNSRLAAEGVYYAGLCWEKKNDIAKAADAYQRLADHYPYSDRIKDAIKREYDIAGQFASGTKMKVLGIPILSGQEKAIELYKHIVKNAPFGSYGDHAQFKLGEVYKLQGEFEEAQKAFQAVVDDYPNSELASQARYQVAYVSMLASREARFNEQSTQRAIEEFEGFKQNFPTDKQALEAEEQIRALRAKKAETSFGIASFYDKYGKLASAKVYYQDVLKNYPETKYATIARKRLDEILRQESQLKESKPGFRLW